MSSEHTKYVENNKYLKDMHVPEEENEIISMHMSKKTKTAWYIKRYRNMLISSVSNKSEIHYESSIYPYYSLLSSNLQNFFIKCVASNNTYYSK